MNKNANVAGYLLVKSDRLAHRITKLGRIVKRQNNLIDVKDFDEFVKSVTIMIRAELTYEGITEDVLNSWTANEKLRMRVLNFMMEN